MSLIIQEINELRALKKQWASGEISKEYLDGMIAIYSQTNKRIQQVITSLNMSIKSTKMMKKLIETSLLSEGTSINLQLEERSAETIRCTFDNRIITREQCLDTSGKAKDRCNGCHHAAITRKLLVDTVSPKLD